MKRILIFCIALIVFFVTNAQKNNLYNQRGIDYIASLSVITNDFKNGKVSDINQETLNNYAKQIPLKTNININISSQVVQTLKTPGFNFVNFVDNSSLTLSSKQVVKDIIGKMQTLNSSDYQSFLTSKINQVQEARLDEQEKELVLSLIAIASNISDKAGGLASRESGCYVYGPDGSGNYQGNMCIAVGAVVGGLIGWGICGPLCALGGAVIGGVIGSLS